jgi:hypothetical protein
VGDVKLSLCGGLKDPDTTIPEETFLQHEVTFDTFCEKPSLMTNQNLVVKLGGRFDFFVLIYDYLIIVIDLLLLC